jgi:hypothetical protein
MKSGTYPRELYELLSLLFLFLKLPRHRLAEESR